jgi:hypothetical protein
MFVVPLRSPPTIAHRVSNRLFTNPAQASFSVAYFSPRNSMAVQ